jgi:hypothetical protein
MSDPISVTVATPAPINSTPGTPAQNGSSVNTTTQPASYATLTGNPTDNAALAAALNGKQKTITSGTAAPTGGVDGDIYLQYT